MTGVSDFVFQLDRHGAPIDHEGLSEVFSAKLSNGLVAKGWEHDGAAPRRVEVSSVRGTSAIVCGRPHLTNSSVRGMSADSDAERLCLLWDDLGVDCIYEVNGPTAFVIFDEATDRLFIFRNMAGRVPFFISEENERLQVSTAPILLSRFDFNDINQSRLRNFLLQEDRDSAECFFNGYKRVIPGEFRLLDDFNEIERGSKWHNAVDSAQADSRFEGAEDVVEAVRGKLDAVVERRLPADKKRVYPVSGGLDSSTVAAWFHKQNPDDFTAVSMRAVEFPTTFEPEERLNAFEDMLNVDIHRLDVSNINPFPTADFQDPRLAQWGPCNHGAEAANIAFLRWVSENFGAVQATTGLDADYLFGVRNREISDELLWKKRLIELFIHLLNSDNGPTVRDTVVSVLKAADPGRRIYDGIRRSLQIARDFFSKVRKSRGPWREPSRWVCTSTPDTSVPDSEVKSRPERISDFYRSWHWENQIRHKERRIRTASVRLVSPLMDSDFLSLSLSIPPSNLSVNGIQKLPLRRAAQGILPESIRCSTKTGLLDEMIEKRLFHCQEKCEYVISQGRLDRHQVINPNKFLSILNKYLLEVKKGGYAIGLKLGSFPITRTLGSEFWWRGIEKRAS